MKIKNKQTDNFNAITYAKTISTIVTPVQFQYILIGCGRYLYELTYGYRQDHDLCVDGNIAEILDTINTLLVNWKYNFRPNEIIEPLFEAVEQTYELDREMLPANVLRYYLHCCEVMGKKPTTETPF